MAYFKVNKQNQISIGSSLLYIYRQGIQSSKKDL